MKAIVFDNAGTLLKRVTVIKDMSNNNLFLETNTIGLANQNTHRIIVVFQTPAKKLIKHSNLSIIEYMKKHPNEFEIAYSRIDIDKKFVISCLSDDDTLISDIRDTALELNRLNIEICSGCAIMVDTLNCKIDYVYTAGGLFFKCTSTVIKTLKNYGYEIYLASGDNKKSLMKVASCLNISQNNIFDTCNIDCKKHVVDKLKQNGYYVYMVGNHTNDRLALKTADIGILTTQQNEQLPKDLFDDADYIIDDIKDVLKVVEK